MSHATTRAAGPLTGKGASLERVFFIVTIASFTSQG
jgi:hypothetical protein